MRIRSWQTTGLPALVAAALAAAGGCGGAKETGTPGATDPTDPTDPTDSTPIDPCGSGLIDLDGCLYVDLQEAVDAAPEGATLAIGAGVVRGTALVERDLTIEGAGSDQTTVDGGGDGSVFEVRGGHLTLRAVTVTGGSGTVWQPEGVDPSEDTAGAGIFVDLGASAEVDGCVFRLNEAYRGGGILTQGDLEIRATAFEDNLAGAHGGGVYVYQATATIDGASFWLNDAQQGAGGGIYATGGTLELTDVTIEDNTASSGGGLGTYDSTVDGHGSTTLSSNDGRYGGGGYATTSTWTGITLDDNQASVTGGAIYSTSASLDAITATGNTAYYAGGIFFDGDDEGTAGSLTGAEVLDNRAFYYGGGLYAYYGEVALDGVTASGNASVLSGGGVLAYDAVVTATDTTVSGNGAEVGGGLYAYGGTWTGGTFASNDAFTDGGGAYLVDAALADATLATNTAERGAGVFATTDGGDGVFASGLVLDGNAATDNGGGLSADAAGAAFAVAISGSAITANDAPDGGGLWVGSGVALEVTTTDIHDNTAVAGAGATLDLGACEASSASLVDVTLDGNAATDPGGGLRIASGVVWIGGEFGDNAPDDVSVDGGAALAALGLVADLACATVSGTCVVPSAEDADADGVPAESDTDDGDICVQ